MTTTRICLIGNLRSIHVQREATYFHLHGHNVHIVTDLPIKMDGPVVHTVTEKTESQSQLLRPYRISKRGREAAKAINEIKPDVIHAHFVLPYGLYAVKSRFHPFVMSIWGSDIALVKPRSIRAYLTKKVFDSADAVHVGENAGMDRVVELGCDPSKVVIQAAGIDLKAFNPSARSAEIREKILGGVEGKIIVLVRYMEDVRDVETLILSTKILLKENPSIKVMIVGDGSERPGLQRKAEELGLQGAVKFMGHVPHDDLHKYLASSDIFVDTAHPDKGGAGIGVALMEALASGLPVVAARRPGVEAGVIEGETGTIFEGGDPESCASALRKVLAGDVEKYRARCRQLSKDVGDIDKTMAGFISLYERLIREKRKAE